MAMVNPLGRSDETAYRGNIENQDARNQLGYVITWSRDLILNFNEIQRLGVYQGQNEELTDGMKDHLIKYMLYTCINAVNEILLHFKFIFSYC